MSIEEYTVNTQVKNGFKNNNTVGLVLLIPIFIIVIVFMIVPLFNTFLRSFTNYNLLASPEYIKFSNYKRILSGDEIAITSINNTIISTLFSTLIAVSLSFLFAWLSSKIHKKLRYILSIMFLIVSVTSILPIGLFKIFSADVYGYMNAFLLTSGKESISFFHEPLFIHLLIILLPSLLGIGPLYLMFTIYFMNRDNLRKNFHFAVSLQVVISSLSFLSIKTVTGFPSLQYMAHTLNTHIFDYLIFRYEFGYGSALLVILGLILALFLTVCNGTVWLLAYIIKIKKTDQTVVMQDKSIINNLLSVIIFSFLLCISIILMYPFLQAFFDSFKLLDELFAFPPKIFVINPTFSNYRDLNNILNQNIPLSRFLFNSVISIVISTILIMIVSIISSIGLSLLSTKIKKPLLLCLTFTFVLSPVLLMSFDQYNFNSIMRIVMPSTFKTASFGLSIYLSSKIFDNCLRKYNSIRDFLTSSKDIVKYLLSILSVSLIASLSTWFNLLYYPNTINKWSLIHLTQSIVNISTGSHVGVYSSLYILSMIIPLSIIIICTPVLINSLTRDDK